MSFGTSLEPHWGQMRNASDSLIRRPPTRWALTHVELTNLFRLYRRAGRKTSSDFLRFTQSPRRSDGQGVCTEIRLVSPPVRPRSCWIGTVLPWTTSRSQCGIAPPPSCRSECERASPRHQRRRDREPGAKIASRNGSPTGSRCPAVRGPLLGRQRGQCIGDWSQSDRQSGDGGATGRDGPSKPSRRSTPPPR